jgi:crotonobetainyl-CoA:carnitine CoA-transferase CaiB-like acyl-CoA transferase
LQLVASGVRYEGLAYTAAKPPPLVGEQSAQILAELGYDADHLRKLRQQGVVG